MLEWLRRRAPRLKTESRDFQSASRIAEDAMIRGDFAAADIAYKSMTESWPNIAFAHSRRGRALLQLGDRPEATREFEHALQLDPNEPEALYSMGLIAQELGRETDAFQRFERAFAATSSAS